MGAIRPILVAACGNADASGDAFGPLVAQRLWPATSRAELEILDSPSTRPVLLHCIEDRRAVPGDRCGDGSRRGAGAAARSGLSFRCAALAALRSGDVHAWAGAVGPTGDGGIAGSAAAQRSSDCGDSSECPGARANSIGDVCDCIGCGPDHSGVGGALAVGIRRRGSCPGLFETAPQRRVNDAEHKSGRCLVGAGGESAGRGIGKASKAWPRPGPIWRSSMPADRTRTRIRG